MMQGRTKPEERKHVSVKEHRASKYLPILLQIYRAVPFQDTQSPCSGAEDEHQEPTPGV
jgi:hypothetical protein